MVGSFHFYFRLPLPFFAGFFLLATHCHLLTQVRHSLEFAPEDFIISFLIKLSIDENLLKMSFVSDFNLLNKEYSERQTMKIYVSTLLGGASSPAYRTPYLLLPNLKTDVFPNPYSTLVLPLLGVVSTLR